MLQPLANGSGSRTFVVVAVGRRSPDVDERQLSAPPQCACPIPPPHVSEMMRPFLPLVPMSIPRPWPVRSQIRQAVPSDSLIFGSVSVEEVGYAALPGWRPIDAASHCTIPNFIASILSLKALIPLRHIVGLAPVSSSPSPRYSSGQAAPQMSASLLQNALPQGFR
jgi:hypothetical protein